MATIFNIFWSIYQLLNYLERSKMVAIGLPMFIILGIAIKALGKLRVIVPLATILDFKKPSLKYFGLHLNF